LTSPPRHVVGEFGKPFTNGTTDNLTIARTLLIKPIQPDHEPQQAVVDRHGIDTIPLSPPLPMPRLPLAAGLRLVAYGNMSAAKLARRGVGALQHRSAAKSASRRLFDFIGFFRSL
jgi:hypothetical protein